MQMTFAIKYIFSVSMAGVDGIGFYGIVFFDFEKSYMLINMKNRKEQDEFITETVI